MIYTHPVARGCKMATSVAGEVIFVQGARRISFSDFVGISYLNSRLTVTMKAMTQEAERLMAEALRRIKLGGSFDPAQVGARIGLNKPQAESAARALSNAGVLVLGFDLAAHFSPAFKKSHKPAAEDADVRGKAKRSAKRAAAKSPSSARRVAAH
jgi:hypothetical protein